MRNIIDFKKKNNGKKIVALLTAGSILASFAGCGKTESKVTEGSTTSETLVETTVTPTTIETNIPTIETTSAVEYSENVATEDFITYAKAVSNAMYEVNKEYFDEKQITVEDLVHVYYFMNDKYYNVNGDLLMTYEDFNESTIILRELFFPQRENELLQQLSNVNHGDKTFEEYMEEVNASVFYDSINAPISNFIYPTPENKEAIDFFNEVSKENARRLGDIQHGVLGTHVKDFFIDCYNAEAGNITVENRIFNEDINLDNYLQDNGTKYGIKYAITLAMLANTNFANTYLDGCTITIYDPSIGQDVEVYIGLNYEDSRLVEVYEEGRLTETEDILRAEALKDRRYQTHLEEENCNVYEGIIRTVYGIENAYAFKGNVKKKTL